MTNQMTHEPQDMTHATYLPKRDLLTLEAGLRAVDACRVICQKSSPDDGGHSRPAPLGFTLIAWSYIRNDRYYYLYIAPPLDVVGSVQQLMDADVLLPAMIDGVPVSYALEDEELYCAACANIAASLGQKVINYFADGFDYGWDCYRCGAPLGPAAAEENEEIANYE